MRRRATGALLVDVLLGMFMLVLATVALMSLFPVIKRSEVVSTDETRAIQMTNRLMEHIQMLPASDIDGDTLSSLNLIDDSRDQQPFSFTHVPLDEASMYSPSQVLREADGEIYITTLADGTKFVEISLAYLSETGEDKLITTGVVVGSFR